MYCANDTGNTGMWAALMAAAVRHVASYIQAGLLGMLLIDSCLGAQTDCMMCKDLPHPHSQLSLVPQTILLILDKVISGDHRYKSYAHVTDN